MTRTWRALFGRVGDFNARIEENVGGMRVVQAFANEDHERRLFAGDNARYRATKLEAYRIMAASMSLSYLSMRFTQLVVMIAGTYFVLHGRADERRVRRLPAAGRRLLPPGREDQRRARDLPKGIAGFRRYTELLDTEPDIVDAPDAIAVAGLRGEIRYEDVTFGYSPERTVLRDIDLDDPRRARRSPSSGPPARARRRSARCCRASTRSTPGGSRSTASTSAT